MDTKTFKVHVNGTLTVTLLDEEQGSFEQVSVVEFSGANQFELVLPPVASDPVWSDISSIDLKPGQQFDLRTVCTSPEGLPLRFGVTGLLGIATLTQAGILTGVKEGVANRALFTAVIK